VHAYEGATRGLIAALEENDAAEYERHAARELTADERVERLAAAGAVASDDVRAALDDYRAERRSLNHVIAGIRHGTAEERVAAVETLRAANEKLTPKIDALHAAIRRDLRGV
jgi:hypothetical protein